MGSLSSIYRIGGLATGLDTDSLVKQLMQSEKVPLDKLSQKKQLLQWQKEQYRDVTNLVRGFKDEFFDVLKPASNMVSASSYYKFNAQTDASDIVTVSANVDALAGSHTVKVHNLATAAKASSSSPVTQSMTGAQTSLDFTDGNNKFNLTMDGVNKTISLDMGSVYADYDSLANSLQGLVNNAFGAGKIAVSVDNVTGQLTFGSVSGTNKITLISTASNDAVAKLGFTSGDSNRLNVSGSLENLASRLKTNLVFDGSDQLSFKINNVDFTFSKTDTLKNVMDTINKSAAGVVLKYEELTDTFSLTSKQTGAGDNIVISNTAGTFFAADAANSSIGIAAEVYNNGTDAVVDLGGVLGLTRPTNNFTVEGVTYNLKKADPGRDVAVNVNQDIDGIYNGVKSFIDKYNELLSKLNTELSEEKFRDFPPLTDDQRASMKEDEIKNWEDKAKSGLLRKDPLLQKIVTDMRNAFTDTIDGVMGTLNDIGVSTGSYERKGQLIIDEKKLRDAIANNPDKVKDLFSKSSGTDYSPDMSSTDRAARYQSQGFAYRLSDIINDNIRLTRNLNGKKGTLIEQAGFVGDATEWSNILDNQITSTTTSINDMTKKLQDKETRYYAKFAALEKAIAKLNTQNSWLQQQFNSGG